MLKRDTTFGFPLSADCPTVMLFMGSGSFPASRPALRLMKSHLKLFEDGMARFVGITLDRRDAAHGELATDVVGMDWLLDSDASVSRLYDAVDAEDAPGGKRCHPYWLLLDAQARVVHRAVIADGERIFAALRALLGYDGGRLRAPVLFAPKIFEPELCRRLIACHDADGGRRSGFTRVEDGVVIPTYDDAYKIRSDYDVTDPALRDALADRLRTRLVPSIERAFQFRATRTERWLVTRYDGAEGGFIRAHHDNRSAGVAHRVFSCTINLNAEDYEGGELRFPEYGVDLYSPLTGGAIIFGSSLLHEVIPVRRGRRYAFVTFLYDEARAEQRRHYQEAAGHVPQEPAEWTSFAPLSKRAN